MASDLNKLIGAFEKSVQSYNRQLRHTKRCLSMPFSESDKDDLTDLQATLNNYFSIVERSFEPIGEAGNNEFDEMFIATQFKHEETLKALRNSYDQAEELEPPQVSNVTAPLALPNVKQAQPEPVVSSPVQNSVGKEAPPVLNNASSRKSSISQASSEQSILVLADAISQSLKLNRVGPLEIEVFSGDPLDYVGWEVAFKSLIESSAIAVSDRLHYLKRYVAGPAREAIKGYFLLSNTTSAYVKAMNVLKSRFGSDFAIAESFRNRLDAWPNIRASDHKGVQAFADFLGQCLTALEQIEELSVLNDSKQNVVMASKLPEWLGNKWKRRAVECRRDTGKYPKFSEFVSFVSSEADILNDPFMSKMSAGKPRESRFADRTDKSHVRQSSASAVKPRICCAICRDESHHATECNDLSTFNYEGIRSKALELKLCFRCFKPGHRAPICSNPAKCKTCDKTHPTVLHNKYRLNKTSQVSGASKAESQSLSVTLATKSDNKVVNKMSSLTVPVWISTTENPNKETLCYALLDTMSDSSWVTKSVADRINAVGEEVSLCLTTMTSKDKPINCEKFSNLCIRGYTSKEVIRMANVYSRDSIPLDVSHIPTADVARQFKHLLHIADEIPALLDIPVGLLIGYDTAYAMFPVLSVRADDVTLPYAVKTPLGWGIVGSTLSGPRSHATNHRVATLEMPNLYHVGSEPSKVVFKTSSNLPAAESILEFFERDFIETETDKSCQKALSQDEKQFMTLLHDGIEKIETGSFQMPLPFKARPHLPDNKAQVMQRINKLRHQLLGNAKQCADYFAFMEELILSGHAEIAPDSFNSGEAWYIPHFGVRHAKKPEKLRVVFDCSARYFGTSLNEHLLTGPDQLNNLVGVLHRFRLGKIAVIGDIQRMFHSFFVKPADRDYLRFLWFSDKEMSNVFEYRMCVHLFGARSSPGVATFGLRQAAEAADESVDYSRNAKKLLQNSCYVDDAVFSCDSDKEMVSIVNEAVRLCANVNMRLHKWVSNSAIVLESIPNSEKAQSIMPINLDKSSLPVEHVLGLQWCTSTDSLQFCVDIKAKPHTRRGILSSVASIFDPLGFVAPVVLRGKHILQDVCRQGLDWDVPVNDKTLHAWESFVKDLSLLGNLKIPRCFSPRNFGKITLTELHHFSDASTTGIGQVSYLRVIDEFENIHVSIVSAKARVAPKKTVTMPRMELQAAVLSAKMATFLTKELELSLCSHHFWTDSKVVLGYVKNEIRQFHMYVSNRVKLIRDRSEPGQWHFIPGELNPADKASRGCGVQELSDSTWFSGPDFLWNVSLSVLSQPLEIAELEILDDPEVKTSLVTSCSNVNKNMASKLAKFSDMSSAIRGVATLQRFLSKSKPSVEVKVRARNTIIKWVQAAEFPEYSVLERQDKISKSNTLRKLDPFVDKVGLLRVGGRIDAADLIYDEVHPLILPKNSHVSKLIIKMCHEQVKHQGKGMTLQEIRAQGYHIIGATNAVVKYISACVECRKQRRPLEEQKMSNLPAERLTPSPPFTYVGADCFGPFIVRDSRKDLKRYGVLFTCMASRAIHLEVLDDMTSDDVINAVRRLIAIRGPIRQLRSDRGSNFVGLANEFTKNFKVQSFLINNNIDFVFNTPRASHQGGVWERQIRTVRNVLNSMLSLRKGIIDSSTLRTFMYEVMAIVNSRPLTSVEGDASPLTPNMLLTMKSKIVLPPPPGEFEEADLYSRKRWKRVQSLANTFWVRWRREYLQALQPRSKWQEKRSNIKVGDIVIVKEENVVRNHWPLAKVIEALPGKDGLVRHVKVQMADTDLDDEGKRRHELRTFERPIQKLVVLLSP
jgi:hypothetical protein